jgi:hypothetical protein
MLLSAEAALFGALFSGSTTARERNAIARESSFNRMPERQRLAESAQCVVKVHHCVQALVAIAKAGLVLIECAAARVCCTWDWQRQVHSLRR